MAFDGKKNFAYSTVATAPSPPTTGTSLVVAAGQGTRLPTPPFNATVWPTGAQPTVDNAEIVRVTAIVTDTLTITRQQEGSSARSIGIGDQIAAGITVKTMQDIEAAATLPPVAFNLIVRNNATTPASQVDVTCDELRVTDSTGAHRLLSAVSVIVAITASGANGLDTGSEAASTWYYVWIIYNPTTQTIAGLLSTSATAPTMPSGYTYKRRVGAVRNDGSSNFYRFKQRGRVVLYGEYDPINSALHRILSAGAAITFTDLSCASDIPSTSGRGYFAVEYSLPAEAANRREAFMNDSDLGVSSAIIKGTSNSGTSITYTTKVGLDTDDSGNVAYRVGAVGSLYISVAGYEDPVL